MITSKTNMESGTTETETKRGRGKKAALRENRNHSMRRKLYLFIP